MVLRKQLHYMDQFEQFVSEDLACRTAFRIKLTEADSSISKQIAEVHGTHHRHVDEAPLGEVDRGTVHRECVRALRVNCAISQ